MGDKKVYVVRVVTSSGSTPDRFGLGISKGKLVGSIGGGLGSVLATWLNGMISVPSVPVYETHDDVYEPHPLKPNKWVKQRAIYLIPWDKQIPARSSSPGWSNRRSYIEIGPALFKEIGMVGVRRSVEMYLDDIEKAKIREGEYR